MSRNRLSFVVGCCIAIATAGKVWAAEPLKVGVARIEITPTEPIRLSGYGNRKTEISDVAGKLWAKALAISGPDQPPAVVITAELVGVSAPLVDEVAARLKKKAGVERAQLAVCATHTHSGPFVQGTLPFMFSEMIPPDHQQHIDRYAARLVDALEKVALEALADRQPAQLAWSVGRVTFAGNRRKLENGVWTGFGGNPDGPVDHALPVLRVTDTAGKAKAIWVNYACHCTTNGTGFNRIHGDWAGAAQAELESRHPGAAALISIGCGADQNPNPRGEIKECEQHGRAIADEVDRLLASSGQSITVAPRGKFAQIEMPLGEVPNLERWQSIVREGGRNAFYAQLNVDRLMRGEKLPNSFPYTIQTWTFGDDLAMVFLAGEVVVDYSIRLKTELDSNRLWINAYANDLPCYIPSKRILREGGYEADASRNFYDKPGRLAPEVEDLIVQGVKKQLQLTFQKPAK